MPRHAPSQRRGPRANPTKLDKEPDVVTAIGSLVPITSMKASSLSFTIAPRSALIEVWRRQLGLPAPEVDLG